MVVTISNQYGAGALAIAQRAAKELGYTYVDRQLPVLVAKRLRISPHEVDASEDTGRTLGERLLAGLERATPELAESAPGPFDRELVEAVERAIGEYARRDNAVIVGRGASFVLGPDANVLRVFMHAPTQWRISRVAAAYGIGDKEALTEIESVDRMRSAFVRERYGAIFGDPNGYDVSFDTSRFGIEGGADLIAAAVGMRGSSRL